MPSESQLDRDMELSEAYQHGRTLERLRIARMALERIVDGGARNLNAIRAVAKLALDMSAEKTEE